MSIIKRLGLWVQHFLAQISIPFTFGVSLLIMKHILGYKWENLKEVRARINSLVGGYDGPLLLCPNHLTVLDSMILVWALTPFWRAIKKPNLFPWNTPEKRKLAKSSILKFFTYLGKCLPVVRQGPQSETKSFMEKIKQLLAWDQSLMIFPEGARSVTGRVDTVNYAYGVGKILDDLRQDGLQPRVMLMYLRGRGQVGKSSIPKRGEVFTLGVKLIDPQTTSTGLRASRDLSSQIINGLVELENEHFRT